MSVYDVIIIGSGFAGISAAIKLRQQGISNILILEREQQLGGTWQNNDYPGAAVDVLSKLYSLSFEPYDWSQRYAEQQEILDYTLAIVKKHRLDEIIQCDMDVSELRFDEKENYWKIETKKQQYFKARCVINAIGQLSQIKMPNIDGIADFSGNAFHTARWDHSINLKDKNVAIIGTGASAVQVVPAIADQVKNLTVMQRTPNWIISRNNRKFYAWERALQKFSITRLLQRFMIYAANETRMIGFKYLPLAVDLVAKRDALKNIANNVHDKQLRATLTPDYDVGCKRILIADDYYPALQKRNVHLCTEQIKKINQHGLLLDNGQQLDLDVIVFATGFHAFSSNKCLPFKVQGLKQQDLHSFWNNTPRAYLGASIPHFPNLFTTAGPNTAIAHTSAIFMLEAQMNYILQAVDLVINGEASRVDVKQSVFENYNKKLQKQSTESVWENGACQSWYLNANGVNTSIYPDFTYIFKFKTRRFKESEHHIT